MYNFLKYAIVQFFFDGIGVSTQLHLNFNVKLKPSNSSKQSQIRTTLNLIYGNIIILIMTDDISKVKEWKYIPSEAFRYFPKDNEIKEGTQSTFIRRIFQGDQKFQPFQLQKLGQLNDALKKANFKGNQWFDDSNKLRFLQANKFSISKTVKSVIENSQWRKTTFPIPKSRFLQNFLSSGAVYICGRDSAYRPILIIDIGRFNLDDAQIQKTQFLAQVLGTMFEFMIQEMFIEGQVQNYILIINLNSISMMSIGGLVKKLLEFTNNAYRSRMFVSYILNTSTSITFFWAGIKNFFSQNTVKKIVFCNSNVPEKLFQHTHPFQVQKRFGGKMPDIIQGFYPFKQRSNKFLLKDQKSSLITEQQYKERYKSGLLKKRKIYKPFVEQKIVQSKPIQNTIHPSVDSTQLNAEPTKMKSQLLISEGEQRSTLTGFHRSSNKVTGSLIDELSIRNMNSIRPFFDQPKYLAMKKKYYESL